MHSIRLVPAMASGKAPDHALIAAAAAVRQAGTRTARAAAALDRPAAEGRAATAGLIAVLRAEGGRTRGGSFHAVLAGKR